jgi:hypothetical protein
MIKKENRLPIKCRICQKILGRTYIDKTKIEDVEHAIWVHRKYFNHFWMATYLSEDEIERWNTQGFRPNEKAQLAWDEYMMGELKDILHVK